MIRRLVMVAVAVVLSMAVALPAGAGPAMTDKVADFLTAAMDAEGCFKLVHCAHAHLTFKDSKASETYTCEFVLEDVPGLGPPVLPDSAMQWNYENTSALPNWQDCTFAVEPPYRWYSDIEDILTGDTCFMYTNSLNSDIGDSSWQIVITPSGKVNVTVKYDPPVFELPDGTPCQP